MTLTTAPITIMDHAWVAADAFVGPGVTVGEGAVVGARASVFRDVPPWTVVGGNPARPIRIRAVPRRSGKRCTCCRMSISVLILTLNEEANLPACLASVAWSDDIVVLDSYSTDGTLEIARAAGARIFQRTFEGEHVTAHLRTDTNPVQTLVGVHAGRGRDHATRATRRDAGHRGDPNRPEAAFRVRFKTMLMGKWLRYSSLYPTWVVRLVRPQKIRFEREINLHCLVDGPEGRLCNHFLHYSFNKGLDAWFEKHNRYSRHEAQETLKSLRADGLDWRGCWSIRDDVRRRRALKELSFRLPFRPTLRFLYMFVMRRGFLDGWPGYLYCRLLATYEQMIVVKAAEFRRREKGLPV